MSSFAASESVFGVSSSSWMPYRPPGRSSRAASATVATLRLGGLEGQERLAVDDARRVVIEAGAVRGNGEDALRWLARQALDPGRLGAPALDRGVGAGSGGEGPLGRDPEPRPQVDDVVFRPDRERVEQVQRRRQVSRTHDLLAQSAKHPVGRHPGEGDVASEQRRRVGGRGGLRHGIHLDPSAGGLHGGLSGRSY